MVKPNLKIISLSTGHNHFNMIKKIPDFHKGNNIMTKMEAKIAQILHSTKVKYHEYKITNYNDNCNSTTTDTLELKQARAVIKILKEYLNNQ